MSREERDKWNAVYASDAEGPRFSGPPAAVLSWVLPLLEPGSRCLDLASGPLRHARALAAAGHEVLAVDVAEEAFRRAGETGGAITTLVADLDRWRPDEAAFDLILDVHYLNREFAPLIGRALRPGGLLALEIRLALPDPNRPPPPFRLRPGEARDLHRDLELLRFQENADNEGGIARYLFRRSP